MRTAPPKQAPAPATATAAPINLRPQGYVNDFAEVLSPADHERLATLCSQVEQKTSAQIAVVTIQNLPGGSIEDFAHRLFNQWGIGQKNQNNGALILVAVDDHKDRVEVGRGLEPILPYAKVAGLLADARPAFERRDFAAGLNQLTRSIAATIGQANGITLDLPAPPPPSQPTTAAGSAPTVPRKDAAAKRITVNSTVQETKVSFQPAPVYPPVAKAARVEGIVRLSAVIDRNGNIAELKLISGHPLLVQASMDAVSKWRYQPTLVNGEPVEVATEIDVRFTLKH